jgi:hypothetical protein
VPPARIHSPKISKGNEMTLLTDQESILRLSSNGQEHVDIRLEASSPVTVRLQLDGGCNCQHGTENRPGSYVDSDFGVR